MSDTRTKVEKLQAMANQTASPNEAIVARSILERMGQPVVTTPRRAPVNDFDDFAEFVRRAAAWEAEQARQEKRRRDRTNDFAEYVRQAQAQAERERAEETTREQERKAEAKREARTSARRAWACSHTNAPHHARGLCRDCYNAGRKARKAA